MTRIDTATRRVRRLLGLAGLVTLLAAPLVWAGVSPQPFRTGLFGVTGSQTIRVSVLNASDKGIVVPCAKVFDMSGTMLAEVEGMPLRPGEGTFVDFNAAAFGLREGQRMQLRAEVEAHPPDPAQPPDPGRAARVQPDDVILTLEVFDTETGRTGFTMPWVLKGFNPQPDPPGAR